MNLTEAHDLILSCASELDAHPLYVVPSPADYPRPAALAYATSCPDTALRESILDWRGAGNIIVVVADWLDRESLLGVALHEAGHLLPASPPLVRLPFACAPVREAELIRQWAAANDDAPTPCQYHGAAWVRILCHLHHRAARLGIDLAFPALAAGWQYQNPPTVHAARALGDEMARMSGADFRQILATPAPEEFTNLWRTR